MFVSFSFSMLLLLGLIGNLSPKVETLSGSEVKDIEGATSVDLNTVMFEEFQKWDAMMTRYISTNGSLTEYYDYSRAPDYSKPTLASSMVYSDALISFHEASINGYYLSKLRAMVNALIEESGANGFYTFDSYKGEIFYVWTYRYNVPPEMEAEFSALYTMPAGISAVWLYQKTGEPKYKNLADRIAQESLGFVIVNNATDMGWKSTYCFGGQESDAKIGVNMLGCIAQFYSAYGKYINSTYASYVPRIINWIWRAQLASGGLSYNIGGTTETSYYTAFAFWYALEAYKNVPEQFSEDLKMKLNNTLTYLLKSSGKQYSAENYYKAADLVSAVKSGFISSPTLDYLEKSKTYVYGSLTLAYYSEKGFDIALNDYSIGYRFQGSSVGALLSTYPLPENLEVFSTPKISSEEYATGRYYWRGWAIEVPQPIYVNDIYDQTGWAPYPFTVLVSHKAGVVSRNVTEQGYYIKAWSNYTDAKVLTYFYPTAVLFGNVSGSSRVVIVSAFPAQAQLQVENGTIYDLATLNNGTRILSNDFLLWQNAIDFNSRQTIFVHCPKTKTYSFTKYRDQIKLTSDVSNYSISVCYLSRWAKISDSADAFSLMHNITSTYHSLIPLTLTSILSHYKGLLESKSPTASWWNTYRNSVSTEVKLVAHSNPEKVNLESWICANNRLNFTISAPSGITSSTRIYVGDKGEPTSVSGADSWSYDDSVKILTINVAHSDSAQIIISWEETVYVDLNTLMFEEFQKWDALSTRYLSTNATISDMWDYTRVLETNTYDKASLSSPTTYFLAMASYYETTGNQYYLNKIRVMVDTFITDTWYRASTDKGTIFYVPKYWISGFENDPSALATMAAGVLALKLYQWTAETKYKDLADRIASESLKFLAVNNSTDMAWNGGYYTTPRDETTAKKGVNRQGIIADFYSLYSQYNSAFASYVPKIIHWIWRSQVSNGGLAYNIGDASPHPPYTAYSLWFALRAYKNVPTQFDDTLKTKMNNTLTWIANRAGTSWYSTNLIYSAALVSAIKSNFLSAPSQEFTEKTKTYLNATLSMMHYSQKGATYTVIDYPFGYRWQDLFTGAMFSVYPLPNSLATFSSPKMVSENYSTGRYYWHGWALGLQTNSMYVADTYGNTGWYQYPYYLLGSKRSGTATRSMTAIDGMFKAWANYSDTAVLTYFYPEGIIFANSSGVGQILLYGEVLMDSKLRVENGTEYNLESMTSGTKILSNNFMVWRNTSDLGGRQTAFVRCLKTNSWSFTRGSTYYQFTSDLADYNVTMIYHLNWQFTKNASNTFSVLKTMATQHESLTPISFSQVINNYKTLLEAQEPTPSWLTLYKNATASTPQLIAHSLPQLVSISTWNYRNSKLTFTVSAPSGTTSTTMVYCSDKGEPTAVYATNGTQTWSFNDSAKMLTLNIMQSSVSPMSILVDWRLSGDVNGDNKVDASDLFYLGKAYASDTSKSNWNPDCDFNHNGKIDYSDLSAVEQNYGRVKL